MVAASWEAEWMEPLLVKRLAQGRRLADLSLALLRLKLLELKALDVHLRNDGEVRETLLVIPKEKVVHLPDGRRIFQPSELRELERYLVGRGLTIRSDALWALIVGLTGLFGLIAAYLLPRLLRDRAKVERWIDEGGNVVYMARDRSSGLLAHLLSANHDRTYYQLHEPLINALARAGLYLVKLTYPSGSSWEEVLGLEVDPSLEVLLEPYGEERGSA